jgi:hypothetical protein
VWAYLVVSAFGETLYDDQPAIMFRKHSGQAFGIGTGTLDTWRTKLAQAGRPGALKQVRAFERAYGERLGEEERRILERFLGAQDRLGSRLRYAVRPDVYRQATRDQWLLRAKLALGRP